MSLLEQEISRRDLVKTGVPGIVGLLALSCGFRPGPPSIDLSLDIDEAGFWRTVSAGSRFGVITQTEDRNRMDHLRSLGNLWVAEASPNLKVAINQPMADFMFKSADLINPTLPTRMIFWESWLDQKTKGDHTAGYIAVADDGSDQIIVISLKVVALEAFLDLERKGLAGPDYFDGAISYFVSRYAAHEMAHAGRQTKRLLPKGKSMIPDNLLDITHPQIFAFDQKYTQLYNQALLRGLGSNALIFAVNLEQKVNLQAFRTQIILEGRQRGIIQ